MKKFIAALLLVTQFAQSAFAVDTVFRTDKLKLGLPTAGTKTIELDKGSGATNPKIKWNNSTSKIQFSNDGTNFSDLGAGGGGSGQNYISNGDFEAQLTGWSDFNDSFTFATTDVNTTTDIITKTAHGLLDGDQVNFTSSTTLPAGLTAGTVYYVKVASSSTFQVSTTLGGTAVDITTQGTGTHTLIPLQPIDGTGGTSTASWTASTSSPLSGLYSLLYAHTAANESGQGKSYAFTIDPKDQGKVLQISFDLTLVSGTYSGSITNAYSDLTVWIYDVTNGVRIQPDRYNVNTGVVGVYPQHLATFQTAINSTSYRFIIQSSKPTATAYSFKMDNLVVGPQSRFQGVPVTDPVAYTPTFDNFGTVTNVSAWYNREGSFLYVYGSFTAGTSVAAAAAISLPSGLSIDYSRMTTATNIQIVGYFGSTEVNANNLYATAGYSAALFVDGSTTTKLFLSTSVGGTSGQLTKANATTVGSSSVPKTFYFKVPITGWSSSTVMGSDAATRVVAASIYNSNSSISVTSGSPITFTNSNYDTHGMWNGTTSLTTAVSGYYVASFQGFNPSAVNSSLQLYKNGSFYQNISNAGSSSLIGNGSVPIQCKAGDILTIVPNFTGTIAGSAGSYVPTFSLQQIQGPSTIAASEKVYAKYYRSASGSVSAFNPINFDTKIDDNLLAVVPGASTWKFSAPSQGFYTILMVGNANTTISCILYKNGSPLNYMGSFNGTSVSAMSSGIYLNAGEYIDIRPDSAATVSGGSSNSSLLTTITIIKQ